MKKVLTVLLAALMTFGTLALTACGNNDTPTPVSTPDADADATEAATEGEALAPATSYTAGEDINAVEFPSSAAPEITGEVTSSDGLEVKAVPLVRDNWDPELLMLFTNNTGKACDVYLTVDFLDKDGNVLETLEDDAIDAMLNNTTVPVRWGMTELGVSFESYRVKAEVKDVNADFYETIDDSLKYDYTVNDNDVTFTVTNYGEKPAHWVNTHVLFVKNGKPVYYTYETCDGAEITEIQPGETVSTKVRCDEDGGFDSTLVYVHGQGYPTE